ncbi:adenosine deaminase 2, partial [Biomphalaria glabrata]
MMVYNLAVILYMLVPIAANVDSYLAARRAFIEEELSMRVGAKLTLSPREQLVNSFLMDLKNQTIQESIWTSTPYPPAITFFKSKPWIDNSTIFKILQTMPKGGVLHLHDSAMTSLQWVIKRLTYLPNLYTRVEESKYPTRKYKFSKTHPGPGWMSMAKLRASASNRDQFDEQLVYNMSIWVEDPFRAYPSVNDVWGKFETYFSTVYDLIPSRKNTKLYLEQGIKEFYDDGVQYMEIKVAGKVDADGNDVTDEYLQLIQEVVEDFKTEHPDFIGAKVILAGRRSETSQRDMVAKTIRSMRKYPDLVKGFDLLQQEDNTHWTVEFVEDLLKDDRSRLPYFFHSGETDWTQWADLNLVDSVLLNATRIGHGYAAYHHPKVMKAVMTKGIAIELNPISNQVLGLVNDLRNHPGAFLIAMGAPVVISSDDPPAWLASPLSHDFYMAFMALGAVHDDLRLLKQLAMNSITFSTITTCE